MWCTADSKTARTLSPAAMGTSCASGKWCKSGLCLENPLAPTGPCLIADDKEFCNDFRDKFGLENTCLNFEKTRCCEICKGKSVEHLLNHTITKWISKATLKHVSIISSLSPIPCENKYEWCEEIIKKNSLELCGTNLILVNNEIVKVICRKSCGLC